MTASEVSTRNRENGALAGVHSMKGYMGPPVGEAREGHDQSRACARPPGRRGGVVR